MLVHSLLVESIDLRRLSGSAGGNDLLGDNFDGGQTVPGEKNLGPLRRKRTRDSAANAPSRSIDDRDLVLQLHVRFHSLKCLYEGLERSMILVRKTKNIAIGAEIIEKRLFVSHNLGLFCLSDELNHVALFSGTFFKNERIENAGI